MANCDELEGEARNICLIATKQSNAIDHTHQSVVSEVSIESGPFAGQKTNRIKLGPFFKPECVKELLPSLDGYPDSPSLPPFLFSPNELHCHWARETSKPVAGWTTCHDSTDWFNRLSPKHEKWKSQRIYEFLKLSTYPILPFDGVLSASLLCCWNPCLNVFITGRGPMTVTLEDIAYITGLSPSGLDVPYHEHIKGAVDTTNILFRRSSDNKVVPNLSFSTFTARYKMTREKEISQEEEVLFINFAICKLLMGPSINVHRTFLPLAANIAAAPEGEPLALGPFLLAQFYRCMFKLRTSSSLVHAGGPLWLLSLWGFLYFPSLVAIKSQEEVNEAIRAATCISPSSACCYGEVGTLLLSTPSGKTVKEVLSQLLDSKPSCSLNKTNWHPCSAKDEMDGPLDCFSSWAKFSVPPWLRETSPIMYKSEDSAHWQSILVQRDLLYVGPQSIGVEVYNPNLTARQFGMIQACSVPFYQTQNRPWCTRSEFLVGGLKKNTREELDRKYATEKSLSSSETFKITDFNVQPWFCSADVDDGFNIWWKVFLRRHRKAKTFITSQQMIFKALDEHQIQSNILDMTPSSRESRREIKSVEGPSPQSQKAAKASMQDATPFSFPTPRTKKRISAAASQILKQQGEPTMEKVTDKVVEEEVDDTILLCRLKRKKTKMTRNPTPLSSGGSSNDHVSDAPSLSTLPSFKENVCISNVEEDDNIATQGGPGMSRDNVDANKEPSTLPVTLVSDVEGVVLGIPATPRSFMPNETTSEAFIAETNGNTLLNGPNNVNLPSETADVTPGLLDRHPNQNAIEDVEAPDSVKTYGKLSARIEHVLKTLSKAPSPGMSLLEIKKASLLGTLEQLVKDPTSFDSFATLMGLAEEFAELAPGSFQSTMDHLKKSIGSIQELSYKLKDQGPQILSSLEKKPELTASMEQLKLEVERKVQGVHTLRKTHVNICTRIEILEAELIQLQGQRDVLEEQLADADNELSSLSLQLDASITALEGEAARMARAESMRTSWDQDMKVFKSAIVGLIEQLRSL